MLSETAREYILEKIDNQNKKILEIITDRWCSLYSVVAPPENPLNNGFYVVKYSGVPALFGNHWKGSNRVGRWRNHDHKASCNLQWFINLPLPRTGRLFSILLDQIHLVKDLETCNKPHPNQMFLPFEDYQENKGELQC